MINKCNSSKGIISREVSDSNEKSQELLRLLGKLDPKSNENTLKSAADYFSEQAELLRNGINLFYSTIENTPVLSFIFLWEEQIKLDKVFGPRYLEMMYKLLDTGLMLDKALFDHQKATLKEFGRNYRYSSIVIGEIRCYSQWSIEVRENFVSFYVEFINWLSGTTFGYIHPVEDTEKEITKNRKLSFENYIRIISKLSIRERIMAKIFYLGGTRALEEVLMLKINDVEIDEWTINFEGKKVLYPRHLFQDLEEFIEGRKRGFVFIGRNGDQIHHSVPYRALKTVVTNLGFDASFTFKDFVKSA